MATRANARGTDLDRDLRFVRELTDQRAARGKLRGKGEAGGGPPAKPPLLQRVSRAVQLGVEELGGAHITPALQARCDANGMRLEHLSPTIGTVIHTDTGEAALSDAKVGAIRALLLQRKVVFFRRVAWSREQHLAFARRFGTLEVHPFAAPVSEEFPEVLRIASGRGRPGSENAWHSDVTWRTEPSLGSVLCMRGSPPAEGGDTLFSDSYAQFDALPAALRARVAGMTAQHDFRLFRNRLTAEGVPPPFLEDMTRAFPVARHPVVRTHPETGRQALYVNVAFTEAIDGLSGAESEQLLQRLYRQADVPEFQCRFRWEENSVAFWDNRACQHYASSDFFPHERTVERVTICGDRPFFRPAPAAAAKL